MVVGTKSVDWGISRSAQAVQYMTSDTIGSNKADSCPPREVMGLNLTLLNHLLYPGPGRDW